MRKSFIVILFTFVSIVSLAQNVPNAKLKKIFPYLCVLEKEPPSWVRKIDWDNENLTVRQVEAAIEKWRDSVAAYKKRHIKFNAFAVGEQKGEGFEDPWQVAWHRYLLINQHFLTPEGKVFVSQQTEQSAIAFIHEEIYKSSVLKDTAMPTTQRTSNAIWTVQGPIETYMGGGVKRDEQANVYRLAIAPSNPNVLYAGGETAGIFKSSDKGLNWTPINFSLANGFTASAMAVLPSDENYLIASGFNSVLYRYSNGVWSTFGNFPSTYANKILFTPNSTLASSRIILGCGNGKIYYTTNLGGSWQTANAPNYGNEIWDLQMHPSNSNIIYAATMDANLNLVILRSVDGGVNFATVTQPAVRGQGVRMAVSPANPLVVYCMALDGITGRPNVLQSRDAGINWVVVTPSTTIVPGFDNGQGYYDQVCAANPLNADEILVGTTSLFRSADGGATIQTVGGYVGGTVAVHVDMQSIVTNGTDTYLSNDGGVVHSTDFFANQANASYRVKGLTGTDQWGFDQGWGQDFSAGGRYHNGDAALWEGWGAGNSFSVAGGESATGHILYAPGRPLDAGFDDWGDGKTQFPASLAGYGSLAGVNSVFPNKDGRFFSELVIHPYYSSIYFVGSGNQLWKSTNRGVTYSVLKDFGSTVWRFEICRANPNVMYVCTAGNLQKSVDGGKTWSVLAIPFIFGSFGNFSYNADVAVDPNNPNNVWVSFATVDGSFNGRVYKSVNGGASWVNYGGMLNTLTSYDRISYLQAQGGTNGGIYAFSMCPTRVYYRDNTMSNWINYSDGLPESYCMVNTKIFYRDSKLKMGGGYGTWESPLYSTSKPQALPMVEKDTFNCARDTVRFLDHSILTYSGAQFRWSFPGAVYVSDSTSREPKVVYGSAGAKSVKLFVQDALGMKDSITIPNIVFIRQACTPDTIANKALLVDSAANYALAGQVNLDTTNTVTLSAWVKLPKVEPDWAGLITNGVGGGMGLMLRPGNELGYMWNNNYWWLGSGAVVPLNQWTHVALVIEPAKATIYMNGKPYGLTATHAPTVLNSGWYLGCDRGGNDRTITGQMDEVAIYNRALSQKEIREQMHLTKNYDSTDAGLKAYYQFNESSGEIIDRVGSAHATLVGTASRVPSTAPVGSGRSQTIAVTSGGLKDFSNAKVELTFPGSGTYPNGDVVATRLNVPPDQFASTPTLPAQPNTHYWIIHNYGTNSSFSSLTGIKFKQVAGTTPSAVSTPSLVKLFKRGSTADGASWGSPLDASDNITDNSGIGTVSFTTGLSNTSFSQYMMGTLGVPLPVRLLRFSGVKEGEEAALLRWEVADELDLWGYEVERSLDGVNYMTIGQVPASGVSSYSYRDNGPVEGYKYYRLKMKDLNGIYTYSNVVILLFGAREQRFSLSPVPAGDNVMLRMSRPLAEDMTADLYTAGGHLLSRYSIPRGSSNRQIDLAKYASGMYIISVKNAKGDIQFKQMFSKQ